MRTLVCIVLGAALVIEAPGQTTIDLRTQTKQVDFSAAAATKPFKTGTILPAVCSVGEAFFRTDAPAGANLYGCTASNTWSLISGAAAGGGPFLASFNSQTVVTLNHGLASTALLVQCFDGANAIEYNQLSIVDANTAVITFTNPQSGMCLASSGNGGAGGGGGSGEINTASNVGTAGVGIFRAKAGVNLEFKNLAAASTRITVTNATATNTVNMDVSESALSLGALGGSLAAAQIGSSSKQGTGSKLATVTGTTSSGHCAQWDASGNLTDSGAACGGGSSSLPAQTGSSGRYLTTDGINASWSNVAQLQGRAVATSAPAGGQVLAWNATSSQWEPGSVSGSGTLVAGPGIVVASGNVISVDTASVPAVLTASLSSYDFPVIPAGVCSSRTLTVTGAASLDTVAAGWPQMLETGLAGMMFVSQANEVTIRLCNVTAASIDPQPGNFKASVLRSF